MSSTPAHEDPHGSESSADELARARLETHLAGVQYFGALRPEERVEVARLFTLETLPAGASLRWTREDRPRMGVLLSGRVAVSISTPGADRPGRARLFPGDYWNDLSLLAGQPTQGAALAIKESRLAFLDSVGLEMLLEHHPSCAPAIARRIALELKWKNDFLRGLQTFDPASLGRWPFSFVIERKRALLRSRLSHVLHPTLHAIYSRTVRDRGREPMFWVLIGLIISLLVSRSVVMLILKFGLQDKLFNLQPSEVGNPIHIHHFNYGFVVAFAAGLLAFMPYFRRILRTLSFLVGFGLGLIFDEFALIVNLHPDYYQLESYYAMAILAVLLVLVTYFRGFIAHLVSRGAALLRRGA